MLVKEINNEYISDNKLSESLEKERIPYFSCSRIN